MKELDKLINTSQTAGLSLVISVLVILLLIYAVKKFIDEIPPKLDKLNKLKEDDIRTKVEHSQILNSLILSNRKFNDCLNDNINSTSDINFKIDKIIEDIKTIKDNNSDIDVIIKHLNEMQDLLLEIKGDLKVEN